MDLRGLQIFKAWYMPRQHPDPVLHWGSAVHQLPSRGVLAKKQILGLWAVKESQRPRLDNWGTRTYVLFVSCGKSTQEGLYRVQPLLNLVIGLETGDLTASGCLNPPDMWIWIWLYLTFCLSIFPGSLRYSARVHNFSGLRRMIQLCTMLVSAPEQDPQSRQFS